MFGRKLIMQVEIKIEAIPGFGIVQVPPPPNCENPRAWELEEKTRVEMSWKFVRYEWRDATWEDQFELSRGNYGIHGR